MNYVPTFPTGPFNVDLGINNDAAFVVLENRFGDGYIQRAADGLNSNRDSWAATWTNLSHDMMLTVYNFIRGQAGYLPFYWQAPGDTVIKQWTARDLKRQIVDRGNGESYWKVSATIKEEFGSTIEVLIPAFIEGVEAVCSVGELVGNGPTFLLTGVQASARVGKLIGSNLTLIGVVATGHAGLINTSSSHLGGVQAQGVPGNITPNAGTSVWFNLTGTQATGSAGTVT